MKKSLSISDLQSIIKKIYGIPDDRMFSNEDLLYYGQKFALSATKNLESSNQEAKENLTVTLVWFLGLMNRYHFDLGKIVWQRYSYKCPFCLEIPCICPKKEDQKAQKTGRPSSRQPKDIKTWQEMVKKIYPNDKPSELAMVFLRKADDLSYSVRLFLREREMKHFNEIKTKSADYFILLLRIFNALKTGIEEQFKKCTKEAVIYAIKSLVNVITLKHHSS